MIWRLLARQWCLVGRPGLIFIFRIQGEAERVDPSTLSEVKLHAQATLALYGGHLLPYYLHEETGWSLSVDDLKSQTYKVRADVQHPAHLLQVTSHLPILFAPQKTEQPNVQKVSSCCLAQGGGREGVRL